MRDNVNLTRESVLAVISSAEEKTHRNWTVSILLKHMGIHGNRTEDMSYPEELKSIRSRAKRFLKELAEAGVLEEVYIHDEVQLLQGIS